MTHAFLTCLQSLRYFQTNAEWKQKPLKIISRELREVSVTELGSWWSWGGTHTDSFPVAWGNTDLVILPPQVPAIPGPWEGSKNSHSNKEWPIGQVHTPLCSSTFKAASGILLHLDPPCQSSSQMVFNGSLEHTRVRRLEPRRPAMTTGSWALTHISEPSLEARATCSMAQHIVLRYFTLHFLPSAPRTTLPS